MFVSSKYSWVVPVAALLSLSVLAGAQAPKVRALERARYQIQLKLDFDALSYSGSERVRWVNHSDQSGSKR